ncbi:coiled-coil-helix-coiled-coil-helix domain-containing protein 5 [Esox lucius]|uniref:Coiled-coil-helix-coiled-coil-helix domain-containing protein 5 n=1 Tax=Esox lucius TaxID=8010 RepID=C1BZD4_ESOLU|nr:coiled-coil-helix-coiled-coil-helix domain-containing protein 5 [Esox lucius]ACO14387.1 Coiled-coil-helix-coiled-coil-helix domain-containing protein 5 [Esox lucius]
MQVAMDITTKHCHKEMENYGQCVASNQLTWQQHCHDLKMKVAQCTSSHPVIQKIRSDCSKEFAVFDSCLRENPTSPTSCSAHVARFLGCAETVDLAGVGNQVPQPSEPRKYDHPSFPEKEFSQ